MMPLPLDLAARTLRCRVQTMAPTRDVAQEWEGVAEYVVAQLAPDDRERVTGLVEHLDRLAYTEGDDAVAAALEVFTIKRLAR